MKPEITEINRLSEIPEQDYKKTYKARLEILKKQGLVDDFKNYEEWKKSFISFFNGRGNNL